MALAIGEAEQPSLLRNQRVVVSRRILKARAAPLTARVRWLGPVALQAARTGVASGLAWFVAADVVGNNLPVFAPLAALLTVQVTIWESVSRGLQRVVGVIVGVLLAYGFARLAGIHAWSVALIIFVAFLAGRALRLGQQGSVQVPVSALLVLALGATTNGYASDRVVDTAIGAALGILVNLVPVSRPRLDGARAAVQNFASSLEHLLAELAAGLRAAGQDWSALLEQARQLTDLATGAVAEVERAATALRWNPAGRRHRPSLDGLTAAAAATTHLERTARGMARSLAEMPAGWAPPAAVAGPLSLLLERAAAEVSSWAREAVATTEPGRVPTPVNTAEARADGSSVEVLYRGVLEVARSPLVPPEAAVVASAITLDAHRIIDELQEHEVQPSRRLGWQSIFGP